MKIALDAQLAVGTATGIGEYVRGLGSALRAVDADLEVTELCEPRLDPWRFDRRLLWDQVLLPGHARRVNADVLHCASGTMPLRTIHRRDGTVMPVVVTVHDVAWLRVQAHAKWYARRYFGNVALERYRTAARIVVDSEFSHNELREVFTKNEQRGGIPLIEVVYPGVSDDYCRLERKVVSHGVKTLLVVGTVEPRKNLGFLIRLLPQLQRLLPQTLKIRIVAVGPFTPYADECTKLAVQLGVADRVDQRGYVTREQLLHLYANSSVVAVPSVYEGFGYAAAQALCAGVPVIVSDASSLPEVAGNDAPALPLKDSAVWLATLRAALCGELESKARDARQRSIERFAWGTSARKIAEIYRSVI